MNVKPVVKVMNFHSLLRVEASRATAERYSTIANEIENMMRIVFNNENLKLDRKLIIPDKSLPPLKIYIGSDFGFCGNINSSVSYAIDNDDYSQKIIIGSRIRSKKEVNLRMTIEEFNHDIGKVKDYLEDAVRGLKYSEIYLVYNHYHNISSIKFEERKVFPLEEEQTKRIKGKYIDFALEGDVAKLVQDMCISYLTYQLKVVTASSYASENIMRQNATTESLKKIDEIELEELREERKEKNQISFQKTIDSYVKQKSIAKNKK